MPKIYFLVPFDDRQSAKALGARWDAGAGLWFASTTEVAARLEVHWSRSPEMDPSADLLPGEDRTFGGNDLFVDLVPQGCWFTNVRSCVDPASWALLSRLVRTRAGNRCEICGAAPDRSQKRHLEAHERWHYDEASRVQSLRRIICVCTPCHLVTHWGYARVSGREALAYAHYQQVAGITHQQVDRQVAEAFALWKLRSQHPWTLDLSIIMDAGMKVVLP